MRQRGKHTSSAAKTASAIRTWWGTKPLTNRSQQQDRRQQDSDSHVAIRGGPGFRASLEELRGLVAQLGGLLRRGVVVLRHHQSARVGH